MIFESVDFPAPFSPTKACTRPARHSKSTPSRALAPGKDLTIPSALTRGTSSLPSPSRLMRERSAKVELLQHRHRQLGRDPQVVAALRLVVATDLIIGE